MKTSTGVTVVVGIGLMTKVFWSFSLFWFLRLLEARFFGDLRRLDLKLPLRGSFTIHDGGTIILLCTPVAKIMILKLKKS